MPTIELTDEQVEELRETLGGRIDDLDDTIRREDPVDAICSRCGKAVPRWMDRCHACRK
jgi:hypothetical protein